MWAKRKCKFLKNVTFLCENIDVTFKKQGLHKDLEALTNNEHTSQSVEKSFLNLL